VSAAAAAPAEPPKTPKGAPRVDRAALLNRGRKNRAVRDTEAHREETPLPLAGPERIDPDRFTGTAEERLAALEGALDEAGSHARAGIDMMKAWLDEQRGVVLREIRDNELYKVKATSFGQYVHDRWQMSRPRAYELIAAAPVLRLLSGIPDSRAGVSQALALAPAYEQGGESGVRNALRQAEATAATDGSRVTAASLKRTVQALGYGPFAPFRSERWSDETSDAAPAGQADDERGQRALEATRADVEALRRMYDRLGDNGPLMLDHDPGQAEVLLREYRQYANRVAFRAARLVDRPAAEDES